MCGVEFELKVYVLVFGVFDLCFIVLVLFDDVIVYLWCVDWLIVEGFVECMGVM